MIIVILPFGQNSLIKYTQKKNKKIVNATKFVVDANDVLIFCVNFRSNRLFFIELRLNEKKESITGKLSTWFSSPIKNTFDENRKKKLPLPRRPTRSKRLSEKTLHSNIGIGCPVEKLLKDRGKKKKQTHHSKTNILFATLRI